MFFFCTIILSNIAFFLYWLIGFLYEIRNSFIRDFRFLYLYLCLCGNVARYNNKLQDILINDENDALREKFVDTLDKLKELQTDGRLILTKIRVEKL
jgi:hypothetical protein